MSLFFSCLKWPPLTATKTTVMTPLILLPTPMMRLRMTTLAATVRPRVISPRARDVVLSLGRPPPPAAAAFSLPDEGGPMGAPLPPPSPPATRPATGGRRAGQAAMPTPPMRQETGQRPNQTQMRKWEGGPDSITSCLAAAGTTTNQGDILSNAPRTTIVCTYHFRQKY